MELIGLKAKFKEASINPESVTGVQFRAHKNSKLENANIMIINMGANTVACKMNDEDLPTKFNADFVALCPTKSPLTVTNTLGENIVTSTIDDFLKRSHP